MRSLYAAHRFVRRAPREALADALGLAGVTALFAAGFLLPGLI